MGKKLLEGIKVADFSWVFAGPLTTKTLADCGAQVIRIEGVTRPDVERIRHPYKDEIAGMNRALHFNQHNTGKLSIGVNLAKSKGKELAKKIVARSDLVVENFSGGAMKRMGLGYEELKKVKPDIIMLSACMQGQNGPHAGHPGFGHHLTALAGFHHIVGWPDRSPQHFGAYTDYITVHFALLIILAALDYRKRTGKGQYIDLSQYESSIHFMTPLILDYNVNQRVAKRAGNRVDHASPHGIYRCRGEDRWCAIAVFNDKEWNSFCRVIGNPALIDDSRFATLQGRKENEDELDRLVEEWTYQQDAEEIMALMQATGVSAGVVETQIDILDKDPHLAHRQFSREVKHPEVEKYRAHRPPFIPSKASYEVRRAPLIGEHNEYVCKEILGLSDDEIGELVVDGALE